MKGKILYIIAYNIRSAYNVGSIFRTADGAGVKKIYLTGYTASPYNSSFDHFPKKVHKMIAKTALGAEENVFWEKTKDIFLLIKKLKKNKTHIYALEKMKKSIDLKEADIKFPAALILGNEVDGVDEEVSRLCESIISIPMRGKKESLNVAVAAGIAIYEILKQ
jgi:tRNA G18 (ribose-2'-O)-methylase SpoU